MLYKEIYRLKRVDNNDFPAIKELFWKVFKKKVSLHYLENKYDTSYLGIKYICSIAYYDDIPVAFYGALPQKFTNNEREIFVAHETCRGDTRVDTKHSRCSSPPVPNHMQQSVPDVLVIHRHQSGIGEACT